MPTSANIVEFPCKRTQQVTTLLGQQCWVRLHGPLDPQPPSLLRLVIAHSMILPSRDKSLSVLRMVCCLYPHPPLFLSTSLRRLEFLRSFSDCTEIICYFAVDVLAHPLIYRPCNWCNKKAELSLTNVEKCDKLWTIYVVIKHQTLDTEFRVI